VSLTGDDIRLAKPPTIFTAPVGIDESRLEMPEIEKSGRQPTLTLPGPAADRGVDLSLHPSSPEPSGRTVDLPLPALEHTAAPRFVDHRTEEISSPDPVLLWHASPPRTLLMIPEPGSALLLGAALAALGSARRKPRR
jgi:hypothetical protein